MMRTHYVKEAIAAVGKEVTVCGWIHETRDLGKVRFLILRDRTGLLQVLGKKGLVPDDVLENLMHPKETVVQIKGTIKEMKVAPNGIELMPTEIKVLGAVTTKIPFEVTERAAEAELDVRLDFRYVDLRRKKPAAIFKIKHYIQHAFREKVCELGFQEIVPTSIVAAATEGGTNLFPIVYFEREAFLSQSPQLYKQLAVVGGIDKVFMTTPAFRAEKHNTTSHLNEVLQMDIEMGFADHNDAMDVLEAVAIHILKRVKENCANELKDLESEVAIPDKIPRYTYTELIDLLIKNGVKIAWGDDFSREIEGELYKILKHDLYFIQKWPTLARAFYSMPDPENEEICNGFDLMYKGTEISSGAQRIHIPDILIKQLKARGLDPNSFEFYINAFRVGAPPHAGWSVGLERIAMKLCNQHNIRECALFPRDRTRITP